MISHAVKIKYKLIYKTEETPLRNIKEMFWGWDLKSPVLL